MADLVPTHSTCLAQLQSQPAEQRFLDYPLSISSTGVPATTTPDDHLRDLIMQVLLTCPGERVNLPEFGVCIQRLVFEPSNDALRASAQFLINSNLRRWLADRIDVDDVTVSSVPDAEETVTIDISYTLKATQERQSMQVQV
jgi:phage baseplate assembly protein W